MVESELQSLFNLSPSYHDGTNKAYDLYIHPCVVEPHHRLNPPPKDEPLRVQIEGPLSAIQKLLPGVQWYTRFGKHPFPQPAGPLLAKLASETIFGPQPSLEGSPAVRDEYIGWVMEDGHPIEDIDYYGVTFDHLVPSHDENPEVLQINMCEMDFDEGAYA